MGIIICKKHGNQGFIEVCGHLHNNYKSDIYKVPNEFVLGGIYSIDVCNKCWEEHDLERFNHFAEISSDEFLDRDDEETDRMTEEWNKVYDSVDRKAWCVQCIAEVQIKQVRRNSEPDPFPVFEKTLSENQKEIIEEREKNLTKNFHFQKSIYWKTYFQNRPAIFVRAGAFTYPLKIEIYYVLSETVQNKIIKFVETFLQRTKLNQVKIEFWELENWIATKNQFGLYNYHRGEEKLLREVYLNC